MKFGLNTLGCPDLSLAAAGALAGEFGFDFVELRALENSLDLPGYFRTNPPPQSFPTEIRVVSTSYFLEDPDPKDFAICLEHAEWAARLNAPYIRLFAGRGEEEAALPVIQAAAKCADRLRAEIERHGWAVEPILETHSGFSFSRPCVELNRRLDRPLGILWDSHHTWKIAGEPLPASWAELGPFVRHVHYKDSVADPSGKYHYVPPGRGEFPSAELLDLLRRNDFSGGVSLEWEKYWHPEIAPFREALGAFQILTQSA